MTRTLIALAALLGGGALAQESLTFDTRVGTVTITALGHGSLRIDAGEAVIQVDPWSRATDYAAQPDADWVWITHAHPDHLDAAALAAITTDATRFVADATSAEQLAGDVTVLGNGEAATLALPGGEVTLRAVPAYNIEQTRADGEPYHPKGWGNGYLATFGDLVLHIGGDTECVPEMAELGRVDVSFLPINLPYTMTPEDAAACFRTLAPRIAVPYHQGDADPQIVADRLADTDIDVRVWALP